MQQPRQMLELTSEDCLWRASQPGMAGAGAASWRTIDKPQLLRLGEPAFCPFFLVLRLTLMTELMCENSYVNLGDSF